MISAPTISVFLSIVNIFILVLAVWAVRKLPNMQSRNILLGLMATILIYLDSLLIFKLPGIEPEALRWISKVIFAFGILFLSVFAFLIRVFSHGQGKFNPYVFWIFQANTLFLLIASMTGFVESGVKATDMGYRPLYGPLHKYYTFSTLAFGLMIFYETYRIMKKSDSELFYYQLRGIFWTGLITFSGIIITNAIIPALFNTSKYTFLASFWLLALLWGVFYVLKDGNTIFLKKAFASALREESVQNGQNLFFVRQFVEALHAILYDRPEKFKKKFRLKNAQDPDSGMNIIVTNVERKDDVIKIEEEIPRQWLQGLLDNLYALDTDNKRLAMGLLRAQEQIQDEWLKQISLPAQTLPMREHIQKISLEKYEQLTQENIKANEKTFGQKIIAVSDKMIFILRQIQQYAPSKQMVIFSGEPGTGKKSLAQAMHFIRTGAALQAQFSCSQGNVPALRDFIDLFMQSRHSQSLLLQHVDNIPDESLAELEPLLRDEARDKFIYLTASPDFLARARQKNPSLYPKLNQIEIAVPPLRARQEDLVYESFYFAQKFAQEMGLRYEFLSKPFLQQIKGHHWPGNTWELMHAIQKSLLENDQPVLSQLKTIEFIADETETLSPLEITERDTIIEYLQKNKYNKNRTSIDLDVTINTLNSKIDKYSIIIPPKKAASKK